jgi:hypothetical protein
MLMKSEYWSMSDSSRTSTGGDQSFPLEIPKTILSCPELDQILDHLSTRHRRLILLSLKHGGSTTETDVMIRGADDERAGEIQLVHNHLPKLDDAGYITWDRDTGNISKGPRFDEIEPLLELIENHADELPPDWP